MCRPTHSRNVIPVLSCSENTYTQFGEQFKGKTEIDIKTTSNKQDWTKISTNKHRAVHRNRGEIGIGYMIILYIEINNDQQHRLQCFCKWNT